MTRSAKRHLPPALALGISEFSLRGLGLRGRTCAGFRKAEAESPDQVVLQNSESSARLGALCPPWRQADSLTSAAAEGSRGALRWNQ